MLQLSNAIIFFGLNIIQSVLLSINNNHRMTNGSSQFAWLSLFEGHIGNEITDLTHFGLRICHTLHSRDRRVCSLGIETF